MRKVFWKFIRVFRVVRGQSASARMGEFDLVTDETRIEHGF